MPFIQPPFFIARRARANLPALALAFAAAACSGNAAAGVGNAGSQLAFGAQMAQRGLWAEAKFRFEQASKLDPANGRALSNLAVAYEALGKFDEARATYERALKVEPGNSEIKRNQGRFEEFYLGFKGGKPAQPAPAPQKPAAPREEG